MKRSSAPTQQPSRAPSWHLDLSDLGFVYGVLFALLLVLINPWGVPRAGIWTDPKVYVLIVVTLLTWAVLLGAGVAFFWQRSRRGRTKGSAAPTPKLHVSHLWSAVALLWAAFLAAGLVTVYSSPVSFESALMAHNEMGDGWLYWVWMAAFTLGNALLLGRFPSLFRAQLYGLLGGGVLLSGAVFVQSVDWTLDFTATMRQTVRGSPVWLQSLIHQGQMPLGFTSNRGHAAFIIAALSILLLASLLRGWLRERYAWPIYFVLLAGLYVTSTRGAQLAFGVGLLYLLVRFWRTQGARRTLAWATAPLLLGGLALALFGGSQVRNLPSLGTALTNLDGFTSARSSYLWPTAIDGIRERPLFGWGFNGYGLAWPHIVDFEERYKVYLARDAQGNAIEMAQLQGTDHYHFRYLDENGNLHLGRVLTNKAHNIVLDTAVSVGLVGLTLYALLFGVFFYAAARGSGYGLEAVGVVYLVFTLTWFESAQYSHLAWWALSVGLAFYALPRTVLDASLGTGLRTGARADPTEGSPQQVQVANRDARAP